ncbi:MULTISPECIES: hypothetical protein, partial [unclassified Colwellia]|uniref:hypothetical protein n=1 Tax=unclassified Colwellia TaxID=196834 RepID=UPI001C7110D3
GSILLIATFLEKIFKSPDWQFAVIISLTSFTVCVLASTISYTLMLFIEHPYVKAKNDLKWVGRLGVFGLIGAWGGFVFGLISFS